MKRGDVGRRCESTVGQQRNDTRAHFFGGLVGEGDRKNSGWRDLPAGNDVSNPVCDDAGLAAAGARQNQQGTLGASNRFALWRIQPCEKVHAKGNTLDFNMRLASLLLELFHALIQITLGKPPFARDLL